MTRMVLAVRVAMALTRGLLFCAIAVTDGFVAQAAEVKVLTSVALTSALDELAPQFEQATGNKLNIGYSLNAAIRKRIHRTNRRAGIQIERLRAGVTPMPCRIPA